MKILESLENYPLIWLYFEFCRDIDHPNLDKSVLWNRSGRQIVAQKLSYF